MHRLRSLLSYNILNFGSPASLRLLRLYWLLGPQLPLQMQLTSGHMPQVRMYCQLSIDVMVNNGSGGGGGQ